MLRLLAAGRSNQRIAHDLVVALNTVKKHVTHVLGKLGAVYLSRVLPAHGYDIYLYLVAAATSCGFGALASATTGVERDPWVDRLYTRCGHLPPLTPRTGTA